MGQLNKYRNGWVKEGVGGVGVFWEEYVGSRGRVSRRRCFLRVREMGSSEAIACYWVGRGQ